MVVMVNKGPWNSTETLSMNKLYKYVDQNVIEQAKKYEVALKDVKAAVFFIGEDYDEAQLKIELNHIVSKGYKLFCIFFGEPKFDSGISLQMGLATKIYDGEDSVLKLSEVLNEELPKSNKSLIIGIVAAVIAIAIALVFFLKPEKEEIIKADNLSLNETYTKALIDAGADSIVVDGGISKEEMLLVESLDLSGLGIDDLEPLLYTTNLRELNLSNNKITDITALAALSKLEKIDLSGNPISNYGVLDYLPKLTEIIK